jgi:hypothetical protein
MTIVKRVAMLALGLITIASTAPAFTQTNGDRMTAGRAAAIRECNRAAEKYPNATYGAIPRLHDPTWPAGMMGRRARTVSRYASKSKAAENLIREASRASRRQTAWRRAP